MLKDPMMRKSVFAGVIAAILVIVFVQPVLGYIGQFLVWLGEIFYEGLSNSFYKEAARGLREKYSFILFILFIGIGVYLIMKSAARSLSPSNSKAEKLSQRKSNKIFLFPLIVLLLIEVVYVLSMNFAGYQMNTSFIQRMRVIRPLVEDKQYFEIKAKWAMMKNKEDYDTIKRKIEEIAKNNNIVLPELLWE
ncbi:MAG: hypothetical protein JRE64_24670 [Deltaproteobacteria bacterium]|nr:hypothetical protein [Deltaproteobacteria bacterium]